MSAQTALIVIASKDSWKIEAVRRAAVRSFSSKTIIVRCEVVDEDDGHPPLQDYFAMVKARRRAQLARVQNPQASYCIGSESAIQRYDADELIFDWLVSSSITGLGLARSASTPMPPAVREAYRSGADFSDSFRASFRIVPRGEQGMVGLLTRGAVTRTALYEEAVILAIMGSIALAPLPKISP